MKELSRSMIAGAAARMYRRRKTSMLQTTKPRSRKALGRGGKFEMDTLEKINKQIGRLFDIDDCLDNILEHAGRDYETKYSDAYLDLIMDVRSLRSSLHAVLDNHNDLIMDIEYALEPLPIKIPNQPALDAIAKDFPPEEIKVGKTNLVEFGPFDMEKYTEKVVMGAK